MQCFLGTEKADRIKIKFNGPSSNNDKYRKQCHSNDTKFGLNTKKTCLPSCNQTEDIVKGDQPTELLSVCIA